MLKRYLLPLLALLLLGLVKCGGSSDLDLSKSTIRGSGGSSGHSGASGEAGAAGESGAGTAVGPGGNGAGGAFAAKARERVREREQRELLHVVAIGMLGAEHDPHHAADAGRDLLQQPLHRAGVTGFCGERELHEGGRPPVRGVGRLARIRGSLEEQGRAS